jgi:glycosyltransferase involved in cell wall biosynthesis
MSQLKLGGRAQIVESRVVHVAPHYPPSLSGLGKVVESLAVNRKMQGLKVDVLTPFNGQPRSGGLAGADFVRRLRSWQVANTPIIPGLPGELLKLPRGSVVHLHVAQAFVPEMVYAAHLLRGLPYVAHFHLDVGPSGRFGFLLRAYKPWVLGPVLRAAAIVVVFTDEQRATVAAKYRIDPARIAVIPNGVDETFFYGSQRILHPRPRLLFVGRLSTQKNLLLFLNSLDGVSERFETTLVGEGEHEAVLRKAAYGLQLQNVRFHGRADRGELRELYKNADVFVLPSEREGMPLVLLEALAMGLPIVATDVSGNRDLVVHGQNGMLVPLGDPSAMRQALLYVTSDLERYRRMSETSRRLAGRYSWRTVGDEFEQVYAQASTR